jgi:hypothetical protein
LLSVHQAFVVVPVAIAAVVGISLMRLRCPCCGHPIHTSYIVVGGLQLRYYTPCVPRSCVRCHADIP